MEELKRLYAAKLRQVSQHAQRSQRGLQLQLFKAQQEKSQLQEELDRLKRERSQEPAKPTSPTLEETQWEVKLRRTLYGGRKVLKNSIYRGQRMHLNSFLVYHVKMIITKLSKNTDFCLTNLSLRFARSQGKFPC